MRRKTSDQTRVVWISRSIVAVVVGLSVGTLFWQPASWLGVVTDVLARTYLMFLGTVMAHEASHGHLGRSRAANFWWGRAALIPSLVPYANFRRTHYLHHAHTNDPKRDPDHFMKPRFSFEIPFRAVAMPHQWLIWLWKRGRVTRGHLLELLYNYLILLAVYLLVAWFVPWQRLLWGLLPALFLVSVLLWYPFALKTHEGFSMGPAASRSHDYKSRFMYWFSLGLSMHRVHHLQPGLNWLELREFVAGAPDGGWKALFERDFQSRSEPS